MSQKTLIIIGSGIAGLACAWLLRERFHIHLIEKNNYLGGHTHTVTFDDGENSVAVDIGFMVFNPNNYPQLIALFEALALLAKPTSWEAKLLGSFCYQNNRTYLHQDVSLMPKTRAIWASWNYLSQELQETQKVFVTYWMNRLQNLATKQQVFVSLNPPEIPEKVIQVMDYQQHPSYNRMALQAQSALPLLNGQ